MLCLHSSASKDSENEARALLTVKCAPFRPLQVTLLAMRRCLPPPTSPSLLRDLRNLDTPVYLHQRTLHSHVRLEAFLFRVLSSISSATLLQLHSRRPIPPCPMRFEGSSHQLKVHGRISWYMTRTSLSMSAVPCHPDFSRPTSGPLVGSALPSTLLSCLRSSNGQR